MSGDQIVALQRAPKPSSLYTHYWIVLPESFAPLEHFDGNRVALDALGAAGKRFLRDIGKEGSASTYLRKFMTAKDMFELRADLVWFGGARDKTGAASRAGGDWFCMAFSSPALEAAYARSSFISPTDRNLH